MNAASAEVVLDLLDTILKLCDTMGRQDADSDEHRYVDAEDAYLDALSQLKDAREAMEEAWVTMTEIDGKAGSS